MCSCLPSKSSLACRRPEELKVVWQRAHRKVESNNVSVPLLVHAIGLGLSYVALHTNHVAHTGGEAPCRSLSITLSSFYLVIASHGIPNAFDKHKCVMA